MKFTDDVEFLMRNLQKVFGIRLAYRRQNLFIIENIPAIPTNPKLPISKSGFGNSRGNFHAKSNLRSYIIKTALLRVDGEQIIPHAGDRVISDNKIYEVVESESKQCFVPLSHDESYIRIFVQKLSGDLGGNIELGDNCECLKRIVLDELENAIEGNVK
ncbi:MAG: hypothetical protein LBQ66_00390 [Planctomycetaceae bacterium]|jgi:hypothetical protein|nr:hypothetical protein [Planctomycetaceae bacterium]